MVKILTDSSCDLSPARCEELGVEMLPITVNFGEESYRAHVDISNEEFYEKLAAASELPKTAQITPAFFEKKLQEYNDSGDQGAENIYLPDTLNVTFALGLLVEEAAKMRARGLSAGEIAEEVLGLVPRVRLWALIDDLKYLKMGGRLSATSALVASILGICPIITLQDGLVEVVGKARGKKAAFKFMKDMVEKEPISSDFSVTIGHAAVPKTRDDFMEYMSAELKKREIHKLDIGSIVGTHTGPGACGLAYIRK